jgi:hypothetical protein
VKALNEVKGVAEDMEAEITKQGAMTKEINARAEKNKIALN